MGSVFLSVSRRRKSVDLRTLRAVCRVHPGRLLFALILSLSLAACDSGQWVGLEGLTTAATQTAPADTPTTVSTPPLQTPQAAQTAVLTATASPTPLPLEPSAQYTLQAQVDFGQRTVRVEQSINARNPSASPLAELLLAVEANRQPDVFTLDALTWADGSPVQNYRLEGAVLRIQPEAPLAPGATIALNLRYSLRLKAMYSFLGWTGRQLNLGDWYPFLPAYREGAGWLLHDLSTVGEHLVYPRIDYHIELTLSPFPQPLVVAASVPAEPQDDGRGYTFDLQNARGFALSISPDFKVLSTRSGEVEVRAYIFAEHETAGMASIEAARDAITLFSELYAPYPYPGLTIIEADFFDGMEFSGLFFLGADYFSAYPGSPTTYLVPLSAHETAHQWWYGLVGNDPALEPWLDEAFCTHSEALFYERYHPELVNWWWNYRIWRFLPTGEVDTTIYDEQEFRPYVDAVYLQGTRFLDEARRAMGDENFLAFHRDYIARYSGRIADSAGALELLQAHSPKDLRELIKEYFGD
jgi:hypothetical protein